MKLLSGELDPDQGEGRRKLDEEAGLRSEYDQIRSLSQQLDQVGTSEAEALDALPEELPPSPLVDRTLEQIWDKEHDEPDSSPKHTNLSLFKICIMVAACVLVFLTGRYLLYEKESPSIQYLGETLTVTSPQGEVDAYQFSWQEYALPLGGRFVLIIDSGEGPDEVWQGTENFYAPSLDQLEALPDRIEWWVEAFGPNGFDPIARSRAVTLTRSGE